MADQLSQYYQHVQTQGQLRTSTHAERYSRAVLQQLGLSLPRNMKRELAKALPDPLARDLTKVFWLAHFRDTNQPALDFQQRVARRSGNTDQFFARTYILAVFASLKNLLDSDLSKRIGDTLSPEIGALWRMA